MDSVSVFLADWQVLFREGIHFTLSGEEDIDVIGEATSNEEALDFIEKNIPAIAVLNANNSEFTGISLTRRIRRSLPSVSVILIMDQEDEEILFSAMKCGASACITKNINPEEMVSLIRKIAGNENPISETLLRPEIAPRVLEEFEYSSSLSQQMDNLLCDLSGSENEILHGIAGGDSLEKIAGTLGISQDAVRHHLDAILAKLVGNDRDRELIETAQKNLPAINSGSRPGNKEMQYVSRKEFEAFKENIKERFKALINELS